MKRLNSRETVILIITITLAFFFIVFQFVIKPMHEGAVDINDQMRVDLDRLMKARQVLGQKALVDSRYRNLVEQVGEASPDEDQMPMIEAKIEASARQSNIHIANIQPQKAFTRKEARFLAVELEIDGGWLNVVQFIRLLQQGPNFYFINELNLEKYSDSTDALRGRIIVSRMSMV